MGPIDRLFDGDVAQIAATVIDDRRRVAQMRDGVERLVIDAVAAIAAILPGVGMRALALRRNCLIAYPALPC